MKKIINTCHLEGWLYDHSLEQRVSGPNSKTPGTEFIRGSIDIATDKDMTNIVTVYYTYITANTKNGQDTRYPVLKDIINGKISTAMSAGADKAAKVRVDTSIGVNDFYSNRSGAEELVSAKRNEGGFIHVVSAIDENDDNRNRFDVDVVITAAKRIEEDVERGMPEKMEIKGCTFDFRGALLPVTFIVYNSGAMNYFESLEPSSKHPVFTKVWGKQISTTIIKTITEESAFGADSVREVKSSRKEWVITGALKETYIFNDEEFITEAELTKAIKDRELYLAGVKTRTEEYRANNATTTPPTNAVSAGEDFKF